MAELVGKSERRAIGADAGAILDDDVAHARAVGIDERLADAAAAGECGDHEDLDHCRVAVVESLDERALLDRPGGRVDVDEVIEPVAQVDASEARGHGGVGRDASVVRTLEECELAVFAPHEHVGRAIGSWLDARILRHARAESRLLERAPERARRCARRHLRTKLRPHVVSVDAKPDLAAARG